MNNDVPSRTKDAGERSTPRRAFLKAGGAVGAGMVSLPGLMGSKEAQATFRPLGGAATDPVAQPQLRRMLSMQDLLKQDVFSPLVNQRFKIRSSEQSGATLELVVLNDLSRFSRGGECFSLHFRGARETPLAQGTYTFHHDDLGEFLLFIVPINEDEQYRTYEAVINRMS